AQAYEAVNIIRRRAHKADLYSPSEYDLTPGLSAGQFVDSVLWERAWELCAEPEGRWFDLMRLEMVEDLPSLRNVNDMRGYPDVITKDFYFRDIPESEIDFNPNLQ
ncbi:MAG: RagB/SusD family nutrient uptake outer membrane protein, partial [Bacteroidales bacterium]